MKIKNINTQFIKLVIGASICIRNQRNVKYYGEHFLHLQMGNYFKIKISVGGKLAGTSVNPISGYHFGIYLKNIKNAYSFWNSKSPLKDKDSQVDKNIS